MKSLTLLLLSLLPFLTHSSPISRQDVNSETYKYNHDKPNAGFVALPEIKHSIKGYYTNRHSRKQQVFYSFFPGPSDKAPVFVMLNGGPGCATTTNLFAMNTAPYTLDKLRTNGTWYAKNPYSWTQMGNLLYIDAPNAGYSYVLGNFIDRWDDITLKGHYNPFIDADQVLRVLFWLLTNYRLEKNQVIFVGESYSGTRVTTMLNLLLNYQAYSKGVKKFHDPDFARLVQDFFGDKNQPVTKERLLKQFSRQVLIQPQLAGSKQQMATFALLSPESSPIDKFAKVLNKTRWDRGHCWIKIFKISDKITCLTQVYLPKVLKLDPYIVTQGYRFSDQMEAWSLNTLTHSSSLAKVLGVEKIQEVQGLRHPWNSFRQLVDWLNVGPKPTVKSPWNVLSEFAKAMYGEYQEKQDYIASLVDQGGDTLTKTFGILNPWDKYILGTNPFVYLAYTLVDAEFNQDKGTIYGEMFLENIQTFKTFLTNAKQDFIIYSPAIPLALKLYDSLVDNVLVNEGTSKMAGNVTVMYKNGKQAVLYYPLYEKAGHSVSTMEPEKFMKDVKGWIL